MRLLLALSGLSLVGLLVCSCGGGKAASQLAKAPDYNPKDQTKCGVAKSQQRPLIVEWPSADRQELESKVHEGLVVVRYQGCEMDVLERCSVPAKYNYRGTTIAQDKVVVKDEDDLYANLPVGAAKLEGKLERSGQLTVDMNLVGRYQAERPTVRADELQGDCTGATHFVYGLTVGAFDFYAGGEAQVGGGAGVGNIGAGAHSQADRETLTKNGDPDACTKASPGDQSPPAQCGALIRIEVMPLGEAKALTPTCPEGTQWNGSQCVGTKVVTNVQCPAGTTWDGRQCAATVNTTCAAGMHFAQGQGCMPDVVGAPPVSPASVPQAALLARRQECADRCEQCVTAWCSGPAIAALEQSCPVTPQSVFVAGDCHANLAGIKEGCQQSPHTHVHSSGCVVFPQNSYTCWDDCTALVH